MRASSSSDHHSYCSHSCGCYSKRSINWDDKDIQYSGRPRSDSSWEDNSFCGSYVHSYRSCGSSYDTICPEQRIQEYMNYDPYASGEESNSREDSGKGNHYWRLQKRKPSHLPRASAVLSVASPSRGSGGRGPQSGGISRCRQRPLGPTASSTVGCHPLARCTLQPHAAAREHHIRQRTS